jgi:hypothetical protein
MDSDYPYMQRAEEATRQSLKQKTQPSKTGKSCNKREEFIKVCHEHSPTKTFK